MKETTQGAPAGQACAPASFALKLGLPGRGLPALSCGCASERELERWLSQYELRPYHPADQQRLVTLLSGLVEELGQWRAPAATRQPMLELLREYVLACVDAIVMQRSALRGTQLESLRKSMRPVVILLQRLAAAYAGIWVQLEETAGVPFLLREKRARSLHRAIDAGGRLLRITTLFGLSAPENCWRNMHMLLKRGLPQQVAHKRVPDSMHPRGRTSAVDAYSHSAMFISANAGQLDAEQQDALWRMTQELSRLARLEESYADPAMSLLVSLAEDRAPIPSVRLQPDDFAPFATPRGWKIDLAAVMSRLEKQVANSFDPLVDRLCEAWRDATGRDESRRPAESDCVVAIGVGATWHNLRGRQAGEDSAEGLLSSWGDRGGERVCMEAASVDYRSGRPLAEYDSLPSAPSLRSERAAPRDRAARHYRTEVAELFDSSSRGLGLKLPLEVSERLRVGELVGVRVGGGWQVGVVRWRLTRPDHCRAGLELLARRVAPVEVRRRSSAGRHSDPIPALMVAAGNGDGVALILPVPLFKAYDEVELIAAGTTRSVTLQRQTVATPTVARFEFV
ncbi:hypothetical protein [Microbulbifer yueqingensis]|uniref:GTPase n=1 Tax=Microbulbifer yueqingensis TaxID=658219 RepID=A0A1G9CQ93_9GAMM|nr:hypothetical protein [Microbulbifer yueqingensis]SDK53871.1 hypothetical protein SAMN05216212_2590 [Microbulbifer yueqingensis]